MGDVADDMMNEAQDRADEPRSWCNVHRRAYLDICYACEYGEPPVNAAGRINRFDGEYRFLSNFYPVTLRLDDGLTYSTLEHAYQAMKSTDLVEREKFTRIPSPGRAKKFGQRIRMRPDWDDVKVGTMYALLRIKFGLEEPVTAEQQELGQRLLATGDALLIEGNTWGDEFWGQCGGRGLNYLGMLLMRVRTELRRGHG